MSEDFYSHRKNSTNIINNYNYPFSQERKSFKVNNNKVNMSPLGKSKTIKNVEDSNVLLEVSPKEEDIDHLEKFHLEKENNPFLINIDRNNSLNSNKIPNFLFTNSFQSKNNLNKQMSGKIPHPRKTQGIIPINKKKMVFGLFQNKRNSSGEKPSIKQIQSKYSSVSENKYHFIKKLTGNQKLGISNILTSNTPTINFAPIDLNKGIRNYSNGNKNNAMKNSEQKINNQRNRNYNTINDIMVNSGEIPKENRDFIAQDDRQNKSNMIYNSINGSKLQDDIQLVKIGQNKISQKQNSNLNGFISNYDSLNKENQMQYYNNLNLSNTNNYPVIDNSNLVNPRLTTVGYNYLNNSNKNDSFYRPLNQIQNQQINYNPIKNNKVQNTKPKYATVTKITLEDEDNLMNNNKNNNQFINNIKAYNNQLNQNNKSQIINKNTNTYLIQEELNRILGNQPNINQLFIQPQNAQKNFNEYNQLESKRVNIMNNKSNIINSTNYLLNNKVNQIFSKKSNGIGLIKNSHGYSLPGKDASGKTKTNQDSFVCKTNINNIQDFNIFGVLDGHGVDGHFVSEFASEFIPSQIINHPEIKRLSNTEYIYKKLKENNSKIIKSAFLLADKQLNNMEFDVAESGCTCCLIIHIGTHIICANTGDSRAIAVYDQANDMNSKDLDFLDVVQLSIDFKPDLPEEISRIMLAGGVVEQLKDEDGEGIGPYRVWVKGKDYPGLAMSRSIGDLKGKTIGVIPDPGIYEYDINKSTKYIIVCSDGVWEFLNNEIVMNIGKTYYLENNAVEFCHELVDKALKEWEDRESIVDDITAVVAFF
jgi:serine/threonine protein phosphatase PrpC